jgi:membrane protein
MWPMTILRMLKATFSRWNQAKTFLFGAALAYYTIFSIAPVIVIAVRVAGLVFSEEQARQKMSEEVSRVAGPRIARTIQDMTANVNETGAGLFATIASVIVLVVGAVTLFAQLQAALNNIWGVKQKEGGGILGVIKDRLLSFAVVLVIGFLLLVSLVASAVLSGVAEFVHPGAIPGGLLLWRGLDWGVSFALVTVLFAMIYKLLPDVEIAWRDVWVGAAFTSLLFAIGKYLIGLYLGHSAVASAYGAAGSLVVLLVWVYYSAQIMLFGAEFTHVYAHWPKDSPAS